MSIVIVKRRERPRMLLTVDHGQPSALNTVHRVGYSSVYLPGPEGNKDRPVDQTAKEIATPRMVSTEDSSSDNSDLPRIVM